MNFRRLAAAVALTAILTPTAAWCWCCWREPQLWAGDE